MWQIWSVFLFIHKWTNTKIRTAVKYGGTYPDNKVYHDSPGSFSLMRCTPCIPCISRPGYDYKNPLHLDVVDRYLRRTGDKTIPVWNRFIPMSRRYRPTTIKLLWIFCLVHRWKAYFNIKSPLLSACLSCPIVLIQIRTWCGVARTLMATQMAFFCGSKILCAIYQDSIPTNMKTFQSQLYRCRCFYWCY